MVEEELVLVLVQEASWWILLLERALCLTPVGEGEGGSLRLALFPARRSSPRERSGGSRGFVDRDGRVPRSDSWSPRWRGLGG